MTIPEIIGLASIAYILGAVTIGIVAIALLPSPTTRPPAADDRGWEDPSQDEWDWGDPIIVAEDPPLYDQTIPDA